MCCHTCCPVFSVHSAAGAESGYVLTSLGPPPPTQVLLGELEAGCGLFGSTPISLGRCPKWSPSGVGQEQPRPCFPPEPSHPTGPPRMADKVAPRQVARLGRTVRLQCPVEGDPPPLTMWTKDGRTIHGGWSRFRVLPQGLKVKAVEAEDAGVYVCKATNGFGSLSVNYTLIVMGQWGVVSGCGRAGVGGGGLSSPSAWPPGGQLFLGRTRDGGWVVDPQGHRLSGTWQGAPWCPATLGSGFAVQRGRRRQWPLFSPAQGPCPWERTGGPIDTPSPVVLGTPCASQLPGVGLG